MHGWLMQPRTVHWPAANRTMLTNAAGNETGGWAAVIAPDGQGGPTSAASALAARGLLGLQEEEMARASALLTATEAKIREEVRGHGDGRHGGRPAETADDEEEGGWNVRDGRAGGESRRHGGGSWRGGGEEDATPLFADEAEHVLPAEDIEGGQPLSVLELLRRERADRDASLDAGARLDKRMVDSASSAGDASEPGAEQLGGDQEFEVLSLAEAQANEAGAKDDRGGALDTAILRWERERTT